MNTGSILVLGGARSGKSRYAEAIAEKSSLDKIYVATARSLDDEMDERIRPHRARRGADWETLEVPVDLADALVRTCGRARTVVVDCLTLWLTNRMLTGEDPEPAISDLAERVPELDGLTVFVSNEVGGGIVPDNRLAREFRDAQGRLNQAMAAACDRVVLVVAGLPMLLKGELPT
ncbi:MAG TPA: bifunctional adenosylcobinamide kinase/adenosylcobinamide-phosphate guanylyltransferase [Afifellaceae bacterium]|nr:bifunctional adenosylcobinamide kinase/adenosylcobinamide-phosphate guanylyltransferase [Afifellaceae bacterium]